MKKIIAAIFCALFLFLGIESSFCLQSPGKKHYNEAMEYFKQGEYEKAVSLCKKAIEVDPKYLDAYLGLGRLYFLLDKPKEAKAVFEEMLTIDPNSGDAYMGLGEISWKVDRKYQKAIDVFKKALEVEPNNANNRSIYVALAAVYEKLQLHNESLSALEKARSLDSDYGDVYAGFGSYYEKLNQFDKAKENYKKAISLYRSQGLEHLAVTYEKILGKLEKPFFKVYLKSRCVVTGQIIEETDEYLKVKGDLFCPGPGDGFVMGLGGESKHNKKDVERIEIVQRKNFLSRRKHR